MPVLLGMILGVLLTILGAFTYDSMTGRVPNGLSASNPTTAGPPPMVNWDVVGEHWRALQNGLRDTNTQLEHGWKKITG